LEEEMKNKRVFCGLLVVVAVFLATPLFAGGSAEKSAKAAPADTLTIYVVRHGQTILNMMVRSQGISDGILTEKGITGATNMGKGLRDVPFNAVYSSDLKRAIETARLAMEQNRATKQWSITEMPEFREVSWGIYEGLPDHEMYTAMAKDLGIAVPPDANLGQLFALLIENLGGMKGFMEGLADFHKRADTVYHITEDSAEVYERLQRGLDTVIAENPQGGNIMLVAHGVSIAFLFSLIDVELPASGLANSSVTKIVYDYAAGTFTVDGQIGDLSYVEAGAAIR
jgi:probable phosphoglycerate mutase